MPTGNICRLTSRDDFREKLPTSDHQSKKLESTTSEDFRDEHDIETVITNVQRRGKLSRYLRIIWYIVLYGFALWGVYSLFDRAAPPVQRYISAKHTSLAHSQPPANAVNFTPGVAAASEHHHHHQADVGSHGGPKDAEHDNHGQVEIQHDAPQHEHEHSLHSHGTTSHHHHEHNDQTHKVQPKFLEAYRPGIKPKRPRTSDPVERPGTSSKRPRAIESTKWPEVYGDRPESVQSVEQPRIQGRRS